MTSLAMTTENALPLDQVLFADPDLQAYAVLDGASIPELREKLFEHEPEQICLFRGELEPDMASVAPYLVRLEPDSDFAKWIMEEGWGKHWGIFALAPVPLRVLRNHFRSLLQVQIPDGRTLSFRFYDPRVLRVFLPTCNPEECQTVFGPLSAYLVEDGLPATALRFSRPEGQFRSEKVPLKKQ